MKKHFSQLTVAAVCAFLGFMLTYQFQLLNKEDKNLVAGKDNTEITAEIEQLNKAKDELQKKNNELADQIKKYEDAATNTNDISKELKNQLDNSRMLLGLTDVQGSGVIIYITPKNNIFSPTGSSQVLTEAELAYLVNELNFGGAEAVSINDNRITNQTGMRISNGDNVILINEERVSPQERITIKAIGDKVNLTSTLDFRGTLSTGRLAFYDITYETSDSIKIPKFNKVYKSDYLQPSKD
ncbi:MAG: DUF881 domain-containing protein [Bacillota bacterium]|nr:DUF881 domain-containing protein [Bacillota bacterium]